MKRVVDRRLAIGAAAIVALLIFSAGLSFWNTHQLYHETLSAAVAAGEASQDEQALLDLRAQWAYSYRVAVATDLLCMLFGLVLIGGFFHYFRRHLLERTEAEATLFDQREWLRATLSSIGDAVIATDAQGRVKFLNGVAQSLTGWSQADAIERPIREVFHIINEKTRDRCEDPVGKVLQLGQVVGLANHTALISKDRVERSIADSAAPIRDAKGRVTGVVLVFRDVTEQARAAEAVGRLASFPNLNPNPVVEADLAGRVQFINPAAERLFPELQLGDSTHPWLADWASLVQTLCEGDAPTTVREVAVGDRWYQQALSYVKELQRIRIYGLDVTERRRAQQERDIAIEFLHRVNRSKGTLELIRAAATFFQQQSGCEAVGIRMQDCGDFPYFEAKGFPAEFVLAENSLCCRDDSGGLVRDPDGSPVLDCMCGNVICGRFDPTKPFFTPQGSFWTNSTTDLLASTTEADRQSRTRNRCNGEGYESVALIGLCVGEQRLGLLQLNDRRKGMFSSTDIAFWERLAGYLAVALAKFLAEESLQRNQADLKRAQAVAQTGSWRLDVRQNQLHWSEENFRLFEIPSETQLTYESFLSTIHPEDRAFVDAAWQAALRGEPYDIEHRIVLGDTVKWVRERAELEFDRQGQLLGGFGTTQDVTERKAREEEVHRLNRTLHALRNSGQAMLRAVDESKYMQDVCRILAEDCGHVMVWIGFIEQDEDKTVRPVAYAGFDAGYIEALKVTWADTERGRGPTGTAIRTGKPSICRNMLTDPCFEPWRDQAIARGYASSIVLPLMTDDHAFGAISIYSKEPDPFSEQEVHLLQSLADDLAYGIGAIRLRTAHARAEQSLRQSEQRYRGLVELSPDAIFVNRSDRIEFVNPSALDLFGATAADQVLGHSPLDVFHPDCHATIRERVQSLLQGHAVPIIEEKIVRRDGTVRDVEVAAAPFIDRRGLAIQVILRDITERKQAEEALRHTAQELARSNTDLQQFAYAASHDLQEPLRMVTGYLQLLSKRYKGQLDEKADEFIDYAVDGAARMSTLIRDLLAYSRVNTRGEQLQDTDANEALEFALMNLRSAIEESGAVVTHDTMPVMHADGTQLAQLFQNLIGNAIKFRAAERPPQIHISACREGGLWQFSVRDNGIGFEQRYADKLFLIFQRLHARGQYPGRASAWPSANESSNATAAQSG